MKHLALPIATLLTCLPLLPAEELPFHKELLFHARFDGSAEPAVAAHRERYYPDEFYYSHGISRLATVPKGRGYCRYPCEGNIDLRQGSLSMWVRPIGWVGAEAGAFCLFELKGEGRMMLGKHAKAGGDLFFMVQGDKGDGVWVEHDIDSWMPGRWRHVAASLSSGLRSFSRRRTAAVRDSDAGAVFDCSMMAVHSMNFAAVFSREVGGPCARKSAVTLSHCSGASDSLLVTRRPVWWKMWDLVSPRSKWETTWCVPG